jgi:hypothetical protein
VQRDLSNVAGKEVHDCTDLMLTAVEGAVLDDAAIEDANDGVGQVVKV